MLERMNPGAITTQTHEVDRACAYCEVDRAPTVDELRTRPTVTIEEAGAALGLSRSSAYAAAKRGEIPTIRVGRRLIVSTSALLRMLEA